MRQFSGKRILITGASGGLGSAVLQAFLDRQATVVAVGRTRHGDRTSGGVSWVSADLTTSAGALDAAREAGEVDVLVHLVGGFAAGGPVEKTTGEIWTRMLDLNLNSAFYMIRAVVPAMLQKRYGRIIAVSSRTGLDPAANLSAYGVSKAALNALIRTVALETKDSGITVNAVLPSVIDTPANRQAMPSADYARWVRPESIAATICWLASDEAADVNGALVPIYGRA